MTALTPTWGPPKDTGPLGIVPASTSGDDAVVGIGSAIGRADGEGRHRVGGGGIGAARCVDEKTVGSVRAKLERRAEIPHVSTAG
jgi:hypothetical protein